MSDGAPRPVATARRLAGWGRVSASRATVHAPTTDDEVAALVRNAGRAGVLARGLGRSYGDAAQNAAGMVLAPFAPDAAIDLDTDARTVRAAAGVSIDRLLRFLVPRGWRLPVLPGTRFVSVGGAIAADVHGKNHHVDGSFGRWVRELTLVDGRGHVRRLSPNDDPEGFWATVGGMGLTGVITSAVVGIEPVASSQMRVHTRKFGDLDDVLDAMERSDARYHVAWVDAAPGAGFGRSVLDEGEHDHAADGSLGFAPRRPLPAPPMPVNLVQPTVIRLFNDAWWRRARGDAQTRVPMTKFFHPLDGVAQWPRLYGRRGFLQWQIAVPLGARALVAHSLRTLTDQRAVPSLVVLKRFGDATPAPLSFPIPGWTLAVDLPAGHPGLRRLLDGLDEEVADAGGRIYLAKDVRAERTVIEKMYPRLPDWRETRARLDPGGRLQSDLGRRLALG